MVVCCYDRSEVEPSFFISLIGEDAYPHSMEQMALPAGEINGDQIADFVLELMGFPGGKAFVIFEVISMPFLTKKENNHVF